ncbi:MAG: DUF2791 family P-loop domain-containing protein [Chloroflexi bacterium]|nr:DUF2791 family P-loop domain-containing protein [Chloroflexota bacterium]
MTVYLDLREWLAVVKKEYLQDFVQSGGAAVKFAIPVECVERAQLLAELKNLVEAEGFQFAALDAASARIHMINQVFHQVAKQVDWEGLAHSFLVNTLKDHYKLPERREEFGLVQIASLNGVEEREMRLAINSRLKESLFRDYAMTQEFRIAMLRFCQAQLDPVEVGPDLCQAIKDWLRGDLRLMSALKPALIFQKIGRHNGRHLLLSLAHWTKLAGKSGLVLVLDISRYMADRPREPDGSLYYSMPAVLECHEVLRQFIDGTDESEYLMVVVISLPQFTGPHERRGVYAYDALKLRVWDEVYDLRCANPLSGVVRLTTCTRPTGTAEVVGRG